MDADTALEWLDWLQAMGTLATVLLTVFISYMLWRYTHKKDRLDFLVSRWHQAQEVNLHMLESDERLIDFERFIYDDELEVDTKRARKYFHLFIYLNFIQNNFFAMKLGIISHQEFKDFSMPTVNLISRHKDIVRYLLRNRGYSQDFGAEFEKLIAESTPPIPPSLKAPESH